MLNLSMLRPPAMRVRSERDVAHAMAAPAGAPSAAPPPDAFEQAPSSTDPALTRAVRELVGAGASGAWFETTFLDQLGGGRASCYALFTPPLRTQADASVFLLREQASVEQLQRVLHDGVPVVLTTVPARFNVKAATVSDPDGGLQARFVTDSLLATRTDKKTFLMMTPTNTSHVFAHELRHYEDYEDPAFLPELKAEFEKLSTNPFQFKTFKSFLWELRAYNTQIAFLRKQCADRVPVVNDDTGERVDASQDLDAAYQTLEDTTLAAFRQAHRFPLTYGWLGIDDAVKPQLLELLARHDLSAELNAPLSARELLKVPEA